MKLVLRFAAAFLLLALTRALPATAEEMKGAQERTFPFPPAAIKAALTNLGGYRGARLPTLEGFVNTQGIRVEDLQRPYSEFKIELVPEAPTRTRVRVKANVSAWYASPDPNYTGYRALDSNGRLESDLLDRLGEYLKDKSSDPKILSQRIAELRAEREATERHVSQLQQELEKVKKASTQSSGSEFVSVARPHLSILSSPSENAAVVLRPQLDDEFAVLEQRGQWLRVELEDGGSGWIKRAQVQSSGMAAPNKSPAATQASAPTTGFTVIRENAGEFAGDWNRLKGKQALYVWAQPSGPVKEQDRLQFAQSIFRQRYHEAAHSSQVAIEGIVIIFMDARGAVAAATLDDIRLWADGSLSESAFLKKCSLDPPAAFEVPRTSRGLPKQSSVAPALAIEQPPAR